MPHLDETDIRIAARTHWLPLDARRPRLHQNLRSTIATARKQRWNILETLAQPDPIQLIPQLRF